MSNGRPEAERTVDRGAPELDSGPRVALVCSPGGHLQQMLALRSAWEGFDHFWVTLDGPDVDVLLADEQVYRAFGPTNRSLSNLLRNLKFSWTVLRRDRPDVVLSTGAGVAVPFLVLGRLLGRRTVYVESLTRTESLSLSGRMVYPFVKDFFVQWPGTTRLRRARHVGSIL
jgi:UDP-N-acetylglucosamine:LPS N-acetylglucosamine transferase